MPEEPQTQEEITTRYRLTLEFDVSVAPEILQSYSDEDELTKAEQRQLQAQRSLMKALLSDRYRYLLDELIRKHVLEDAEFEVGYEEVKSIARVRDISEDVLLEAAIDSLSVEDQQYYQEAIDHERFGKAAEDVVNSVEVNLSSALLEEVEIDEEDSYGF
ncbi:MAG: hypothetical protein ACRDHW_21205 [Ktedonobacteraceae bacterium]